MQTFNYDETDLEVSSEELKREETATDIVQILYDVWPEIEFYDERDDWNCLTLYYHGLERLTDNNKRVLKKFLTDSYQVKLFIGYTILIIKIF